MDTMKVIFASKGHVLTDGQTYGTAAYLPENRSESEFYEITIEEYEAIKKQLLEQEGNEADIADMKAALEVLGVNK
jgi:hypothetical protein